MTPEDVHQGHADGLITCDAPGCTRSRRHYCSPAERDTWYAVVSNLSVRDFCPVHNTRPRDRAADIYDPNKEQ